MNNITKGSLHLFPANLSENGLHAIPEYTLKEIRATNRFVVEREKTARRFLKAANHPVPLQEIELFVLDKRTTEDELMEYLQLLLTGERLGLLSEAGLPCIADPGAQMVELAHQNSIEVVPYVGPSSMMLALMASGLNGQSFAFVGYLPIKNPERKKEISRLEALSSRANQTQIFIETPYRNHQLLEELINTCSDYTRLCVACDLTGENEWIVTKQIGDWKQMKYNINKRPAVFLLLK